MALTQQPPTLHVWSRRRRKPLPLQLLLTALAFILIVTASASVEPGQSFLFDAPLDLLLPADGLSRLALGEPPQDLERRQQSLREVTPLKDGVPGKLNLQWGWEAVHHITRDEVFKDSTDDRRTIHLTFNTCIQPQGVDDDIPVPPQLDVYVSNTTANRSPGPGVQGKYQIHVPVDKGFGALDFDATGDVWVSVTAPELKDNMKKKYSEVYPWNYELVLSTSHPYHGYIEDQFLYLVDTDDSTALLITGNMTDNSSHDGGIDETLSAEELMKLTTEDGLPYQMYAQNMSRKSRFSGLEKSFCAVSMHAEKRAGDSETSMTTRGLGGLPKQQFLLRELERASGYLGYLVRPSSTNSSGILWQPIQVHTKHDGNCRIIYDLPFCSEAAYAVPSNPTMWEFGEHKENLTYFYDNLASSWWANFTYSLQQVQCDAKSDAKYSLIRNCDDCAAAYKNWLCAVTIPRCYDHSANLTYLAERSSRNLFWNASAQAWAKHTFEEVMTDEEVEEWVKKVGKDTPVEKATSRNPAIDKHIMPGPYKEIKPCKDLCWSLVQSCPSSMGFMCPAEGSRGLEMSYGERDPEGDITCSYLGAVYFLNRVGRLQPEWIGLAVTMASMVGLLMA